MSVPRKQPSQQRSREMVEWIVEAAARVFEREGIDATTNRIAEEAGVSIGSLYQYFPNKHALLDELARRHLAEARVAMSSVWDDDGGDVRSYVERVLGQIVRVHEDRGGLHRVMRVYAGQSPDVEAGFVAILDELVARIEGMLDRHGIDDAHGRARMIVATADAQVHGILTTGDAAQRAARLRLVIDQVMAVITG